MQIWRLLYIITRLHLIPPVVSSRWLRWKRGFAVAAVIENTCQPVRYMVSFDATTLWVKQHYAKIDGPLSSGPLWTATTHQALSIDGSQTFTES
jgi:hypothetical protein